MTATVKQIEDSNRGFAYLLTDFPRTDILATDCNLAQRRFAPLARNPDTITLFEVFRFPIQN